MESRCSWKPNSQSHSMSFSFVNIDLTWGRLFNRLREMAPEPQPTSRQVGWAAALCCRSWRTRSTNSYQKKTIIIITGVISLCRWRSISLFFPHQTSVSGLGMNTGGLIFRVRSLKSHSSITYCTGILHNSLFITCISQSISMNMVQKLTVKMKTWIDVWCTGAISAESFRCQEAELTVLFQDFQSGWWNGVR